MSFSESDSFFYFIQYPVSSIQYPVSSIQYPVSSIQYPVSSIKKPERLETLSHSVDIRSVMLINFATKYFIETKKLSFLLVILFASLNLFSQTKTNLDIFYSLTDTLVDQINSEIPSSGKKILLTLNLGQSYSLFSNSIKERFKQSGKEILEQQTDELNIPNVNIVLEGAGVEYGEMFRDGWFGTHYIQRYSTIFGNYLHTLSAAGKKEFEITSVDTVKVEDLKFIENDSFPFTKGTIPSEPFLSGFAEPLIAIGTAAAVIVIFFTVRSE